MDNQVILVTGASSGFGYDAAYKLIGLGHIVYCAARNLDKMKPLEKMGGRILKMDVTSDDDVSRGVGRIIRECGHIDAVINSAGYGGYGMLERVGLDEAKRQMDTNVFGTMRVIRQVLPYMRRDRSGRIINLSSVIGKCYIPALGWYGASKHVVENISDTLRVEIKRYGVSVSVVEPGPVSTGFLATCKKSIDMDKHTGAYRKNAKRFMRRFSLIYKFAPGPGKVGDTLVRAVVEPRPKKRYAVGLGAKVTILLAKLPTAFYDRAVQLIFGIK